MDNKIKAIIVLVVMALSAGPLGFFSGQPAQQITPPKNDSSKTFYETVSANVTALVEELDPTLIYSFTSGELNEPLVRERLARVPGISNYTLSFGINPLGDGYQYVVKARLTNLVVSNAVGFEMVYQLSDFARLSDVYPMMFGKAAINGTFLATKGDGTQVRVDTKGTKTVDVFLYYWNRNQTAIGISCPRLLVSTANGAFLRSQGDCTNVDEPAPGLFGLPSAYYSFVEQRIINLPVRVTDVLQQDFEGRLPPEASESQLKELMLSAYDPREYELEMLPNESADALPRFKLRVPLKSEQELVVVRNALSQAGYRATKETRVGQFRFTQPTVRFELIDYDLSIVSGLDNNFARLKKDSLPGNKTLSVTFGLLLNELVSVIGEEL